MLRFFATSFTYKRFAFLLNCISETSTATRSCRDPGTAVIHCLLPGGVRRRPQRVTSAGMSPAAADATRYGRRRCYCGRAPPLVWLLLLPPPPLVLLRLLLVLLYGQFGN